MAPPRYPRIPHLVGGRGTADDLVLDARSASSLLQRPVVVEEKLDGASVMLWSEDEAVQVGLRSGGDGIDRAGQRGRLRAWAAERSDPLRDLLWPGGALYGEWLYLTHAVGYDRLPSYLAGLDLIDAAGTFLPVDERNRRLERAGISPPPELARGVMGDLADLERLLGRSRFGAEPMEGLVIRSLDGEEPRIAKLLRPGFRQAPDEAWTRGRPVNRVG